jgi:phospholipase/carboxylesterase
VPTMTASYQHHLHTPLSVFGASLRHAEVAVLLLHGRAQTPADMFDCVVRRLDLPQVAWLAPTASDNSWYPSPFMAPREINQPQLDHALARVAALSTELANDGFAPDRQVVLGFSQGACLSCEYVWHSRQRYRALIALTGGLIGPPGMQWNGGGRDFCAMPVFLSDREQDPWVPAARVLETGAAFRAAGAQVHEHIVAGSTHEVTAEEIAIVRTMLLSAMERPR